MERYVTAEYKKLNQKRKIINDLVRLQKPVYAWGIGREFLYLYESAGLKNCLLAGLIDMNQYKQKKFSVGGRKIQDQRILKKAKPNSTLIISAMAHVKPIKESLPALGYRGQIANI